MELIGRAFVIFAIFAPLAWCTAQDTKDRAAVKIACIEARGDISWGECVLPDPPK